MFRLSYPSPVSFGSFMNDGALKTMARMVANSLFKWDILRDKNNTIVSHGDDVFLMWECESLHMVQRWSSEDIKGNMSKLINN